MNLHQLKLEICEIGRRIYNKGFAAANDGNISYRLGENEVLCTPTMVSKGFMKPDDLCIVDMEGKQLAGKRKRTSEILLHLAIMKERPDVKSVRALPSAACHGVRRGPRADSAVRAARGRSLPGRGADHASTKRPAARRSPTRCCRSSRRANVIILANHGTVSFGETVEKAYWWTEILDAYCRILMLAKRPGQGQLLHRRQRRASCWI